MSEQIQIGGHFIRVNHGSAAAEASDTASEVIGNYIDDSLS